MVAGRPVAGLREALDALGAGRWREKPARSIRLTIDSAAVMVNTVCKRLPGSRGNRNPRSHRISMVASRNWGQSWATMIRGSGSTVFRLLCRDNRSVELAFPISRSCRRSSDAPWSRGARPRRPGPPTAGRSESASNGLAPGASATQPTAWKRAWTPPRPANTVCRTASRNRAPQVPWRRRGAIPGRHDL